MPDPNQIGPISGVNPPVNQMNFGQLVGRVSGYNRACSPSIVQNLVNDVLRRVYDRRGGRWYGLLVRGQIVSSGYYSTGTINLIANSASVTGVNTAWTSALVGQQLRVGFTAPVYTILAVPSPTSLVIDMPWGLPSQSSASYFIARAYYSFPNIRYFLVVKNLQLMFRMYTNIPVSRIDTWDPSRLQILFPYVVAAMPPDPSGNYQVELWPAPNTPQSYPYLAAVQRPTLKDDSDPLPAFIRADVIELGAIAEVLLHNPKLNPGYSESVALSMSERFKREFESELEHAAQIDEGLYRQDIITREEMWPYPAVNWETGRYIGGGAFLAAMSPVSADVDDY